MTHPPVGRRLMIVVDEDTTFEHKPVYTQIMQRALDAGLAGASVFRGIEGFGASRHLHTSRILSLTERLPVMIVIIDSAENVDRFLPQLDDLGVRGVVALDDVEIVRPGAGRPAPIP
jgi:PII-like signaling protein